MGKTWFIFTGMPLIVAKLSSLKNKIWLDSENRKLKVLGLL